ncbi:hypothetical protein [Pyxidicoccus xibeiensis]|uniref:hypothetical protein n=1 Tax=Pyxidicoccus xibeiensis TaxID=2906759 RepID=UPI0020A6DE95|nr:hypothetical protein [Pyxidicoccus xibeiensis]MCP3142240.1 hypothetical protein [Pyxidicoccus xibeiensis]
MESPPSFDLWARHRGTSLTDAVKWTMKLRSCSLADAMRYVLPVRNREHGWVQLYFDLGWLEAQEFLSAPLPDFVEPGSAVLLDHDSYTTPERCRGRCDAHRIYLYREGGSCPVCDGDYMLTTRGGFRTAVRTSRRY